MDTSSIVDTLTSNHIPEVMLAVGGILAVLIAYLYVKDKDSTKYKFAVLFGLIAGALLAIVAFSMFAVWGIATSILIILAAFTLIIRPFREVQFSIIIALMVIIIVYVMLAELAGTWLDVLSNDWPRIAVSLVCGAMVYMILHMVESIVKMVGKVMNAWPLLFVLGIICMIEAVMVAMGYGSLFDYIRTHTGG